VIAKLSCHADTSLGAVILNMVLNVRLLCFNEVLTLCLQPVTNLVLMLIFSGI
jgi:hypothetical protein